MDKTERKFGFVIREKYMMLPTQGFGGTESILIS